MNKQNYTDINSKTWDKWAKNDCEWSRPIGHEEYVKAQNGDWGVYLTPCIYVPKEWFGALAGKKLLGLASGGGQQMPVFAALGSACTVFDYSDSQLDAERFVAEREGYPLNIVKGDMAKRLPFDDNSFDIIFNPVSNCYIEDVYHVWNECYRVLKTRGILLAGFDNGMNFLFDDDGTLPLKAANKLPFNPLKDEKLYEKLMEGDDGVQFSHSLEEQIGGQLKAGFTLTDLYEDRDRVGCGVLREYTPQYIATRAIKK
jgi:SAM-dependent methyltransferase